MLLVPNLKVGKYVGPRRMIAGPWLLSTSGEHLCYHLSFILAGWYQFEAISKARSSKCEVKAEFNSFWCRRFKLIAREFPEREDPGVMTAFIGRAELGPQCWIACGGEPRHHILRLQSLQRIERYLPILKAICYTFNFLHNLILKTEHLERQIKRLMRGLEREEQDSGEGNYLIPSPIISRRGASCLLPRSGVRPSMSRDLSK